MVLSIITATYNSEKTIRSTIESVAKLSIDYEHIIIDGLSTDSTIDIIKEYPKVKWISERDIGVYDALNKGILLCSGKWIYILGSDDELFAHVVNNMKELFCDSDLDLIYGSVWVRSIQKSYFIPFTIENILTSNICQQAIFYSHKLFHNRLFDLKYKISADYAFNIEILCENKLKIHQIPVDIALYDGNGMSENLVDNAFLTSKMDLLCAKLGKKRQDRFFDAYRHQEAINQILLGNIVLGWQEMFIYSMRKGNWLKNLRTVLGMTKERVIKG